MTKILLIDEDKASIHYYLLELKDNEFEVTHARSPDEAAALIEKRGAEYELVIMDSAMPPGEKYRSGNTEAGTSTGQFIFADIRKSFPDKPILILTNFPDLDWITQASTKPNVRAVKKLDQMPSELVQSVRDMIKAAKTQ